MLIDISKIKVNDRIRKDFGNIQELADDIKENGLINPPVVTPDTFELIAGERRLRAMKLLGYQQVEVRPMAVKDAEHQLNLEISENETRKDFSKAERIDYARRLERVESLKARERMETGISPSPNLDKGRTDEIVANKLGIGGKDTYRKEKYIVDNQTTLSPEDFADWDEGKLSTNKAFNKIKQQMLEATKISADLTEENKELNNKLNQLSSLQSEINKLQKLLDNRPTVEIEKEPSDYSSTKKMLNDYKNDYSNLKKQFEEKANELNKVKKDLEIIMQNTPQEQFNKKLKDSTIFFCARISEFLEKVGGYIWIVEHISELPEYERKSYLSAINSISAWAENLRNNIK